MKLKLISFLAVFLISGIFQQVFSQNLQISGKVTRKSNGEALPGASVMIKGGGGGARTDENGNYTISTPQKTATIVVSYTGMLAAEKSVSESGTLDFALEEDVSLLTDVVVIGYGTQKITKVSGAVATVKSADIEKLKPVRAEEALQGLASGVNVIQSGSPGAKPTVLVRGIPSFSGTDPVVIIDGSPQSITDFNSISPSDIESINVLKDAATTAIYGVKGGNGVIVVTTKTGRKNQKTEFIVNANYGVQQVQRKLPVLNATEYAAMVNEGSTLSGGNIIFTDLSSLGKGVNWQDEVFRNAPVQNHSLSARGGSNNLTYFLSAAYSSQGGIVGGYDKSRFNRGTFTSNLVFDLSSKWKFFLNTTGVLLDSKGLQENSFNSIIGSAVNFDPTVPLYDNDPNIPGEYGYSNLLRSEIFNPLTKLANTYNTNQGFKLYGKAELQFSPMKNLRLNSRFGYTKYDDRGRSFTPLVYYGPLNVENTMNADGSQIENIDPVTGDRTLTHNSVSHWKNSNFNFTWESFASYDFNLQGSHNFQTVAGLSLAKISGNGSGATRQDVPFNSWEFAHFESATGVVTREFLNGRDGNYFEYFRKNLSYFGRVNYDYNDKYLASFTARRDGSFAFGPDNKFANFFSGSLGWVVSKEDFFKTQKVNFLKLRASYGSVGNENVDPQSVSISTGGPSYGPTQNSNGYTFGDIFIPGSSLASTVNTALRWEEQKQFNAGFDVAVLNNKLTLSADYFRKDVQGLLFVPSASLYLGTVPIPVSNIGSTRSSGVDLSLGYNGAISKKFQLGTTVTFTTSTNKVTETNSDGTAKIFGGNYFNGQSQDVTVFEKGQTPGYFYGYVTNGLFQNKAEVDAGASQPGALPGDIRFVDLNGDGVINADDRTKIGDPFPDFVMGWNLNLSYSNVDLSVFTYASVGNDIYRAFERNANYTNKARSVLSRWTGEGTTNDARYPRYSFVDGNNNARASDRYVEDGSFVKIKNIQLGYTFPASLVKNVFKSLRVYGQVRNAFTFTKYSGLDPEIAGGVLDTGVDRGAYPQARTFAIGVDIKL